MFNKNLAKDDPKIANLIQKELKRQRQVLEMVASENFAPISVLEAQGSILSNKISEGYPGKRYYGGCEFIDEIEQTAINRAKNLFGAEHANVQPHCGSDANAAAISTLIKPGDTILGLELSHGGHLSHGLPLNFSGRYYNATSYKVNPVSSLIEYEDVLKTAKKYKPQLIIAGWTSYTRNINFADFKKIADSVGAYLLTDMAHFAGLTVAKLYNNPCEYSDIVTSTTYKTLGGAKAGLILSKNKWAKKVDSYLFPGTQGSPQNHSIAGKAVTFKIAQKTEFKNKMKQTVKGAKIIANRLMQNDIKNVGIKVLTGGTDTHIIMLNLKNYKLNGKETQNLLDKGNITVNKNTIPYDTLPPTLTSGIRIGTSALASRGFTDVEFEKVSEIIATILKDMKITNKTKIQINKITATFPLYQKIKYY